VEDLSLLPLLYTACETVLVANNSLLGLRQWDSGSVHSGCDLMAAPAVAGCAVLVGAQGGSVSAMADDLNGAAVAAAEEAAAAVRNAGVHVKPECLVLPHKTLKLGCGKRSYSVGNMILLMTS